VLNSLWKTNNLNLIIFFLFSVLVQNVRAEENNLDFASALKAAQSNSFEHRKLKSEVLSAEADLQIARSADYPRLGVESRYEIFKSDTDDLKGTTSNVFAEWSLFNGFRDLNNRKTAEDSLYLAEMQLLRYDKTLKSKIRAIYSKAYSLQQIIRYYNQTILENQKNLKSVKLRRSSGLVADSDELEFDLFDSKLKFESVQLITEHQSAVAELKLICNLENIDHLMTDLELDVIKLKIADIEKLLENETSKLQQSQQAVHRALLVKNRSRAEFLPQVILKATYGSTGLVESQSNPETVLGLTAKWEFFSGFETSGRQKMYSSQLFQAETKYLMDQLATKSQVQQIVSRLNHIMDRLILDMKNPMSVEKYLKAVSQEYKRGAKSSADLKSASELALNTLISKEQIKAEYFQSLFELQDILGVDFL
jgi:outer membrane protein TolC